MVEARVNGRTNDLFFLNVMRMHMMQLRNSINPIKTSTGNQTIKCTRNKISLDKLSTG